MTPLPRQIGPYDVLEEIGRGGMGVVYVARDPRLERRVAIKTLSQGLSGDREWSERFHREARLLASLNHPNIATIYSLEQDGDLVFLTMELIAGQSLGAMIQSGALSLPDALSIGRQIARGLEAAHGASVIHRDLKPLNVMITPESHAKILDFGLATRAVAAPAGGAGATEISLPRLDAEANDATVAIRGAADGAGSAAGAGGSASGSGSGSERLRASATTGAGTPGYMSPEQILGEDLDERTDIWAFGCVLYESLCGMRAFRGSTAQERIHSTLRGAADLSGLPPQTPESVRELIRACLQTDRDARLRSATDAREILEVALARRSWEMSPTEPGDSAADRAGGRPEVSHNLPIEATPLVGRSRELAHGRELLDRGRLVTLTGVGGGGKTRLAIRLGMDTLDRFPDGVWIVELAPVPEGAGVIPAVAKALGVSESAGRTLAEAVLGHVSRRSLLLILDNCEHVVQTAAAFAGALLAASGELKILATSREMLGLSGESIFEVPPLQVPPAQARSAGGAPGAPPLFETLASTESVQLFSYRAAQVRPDFRLGPENIEDIAEICRRLEGIPLAIELAAARTKSLSLPDIARRLADRFRLLKGTSRSALPHHQTLEALIDWSHASLTENEQRLFRRLAPFRGGWTLEAAESVCPDSGLEEWEILDVLARLIEKSLVVFTHADGMDAAGGTGEVARATEPRYRMLETVREYAQAKLRESSDAVSVQEKFQSYFATLAETAAQHLTGPAQSEWLGRLDTEIDNLRAVIAQSLEAEDPLPALRITGSMLRYWMIRAQWREGRAALERAIAMPGAEELIGPLGTALNSLGSCCYQLNDLEVAARHYQRAVDGFMRAGERRRAGPPLVNLGNVYRMKGELDKAVASLNDSLQCFDVSDQWMLASVQANLGSIELIRERYEEAWTCYETAIGMYRNLGDRAHTAMTIMNKGLVAHRLERFAEARTLFEESAEIFEELGERNIGASAQVNLGIVLLALREEAQALATFTKALRIVVDTGSLENIAACFEGLSQLARWRGDVARSVRLAGAAESIRITHEIVRQPVDQSQWDAENREYALQVGEELYARHFAEGQALELEVAVSLGLEMAGG